MSKQALDPINLLAIATAPTLPTLKTGDTYFNTTTNSLFIYNGSTWSISGPVPIANAIASVTGYSADTYLAGSAITIPAGTWKAKTQYKCVFDMQKTAAGTSAFTVNVRMGTLGTTSDASVLSLAFAVGTAAVDTGKFELFLTFRAVGASAIVQGLLVCVHSLAATGLTTTGAAGNGIVLGTSATFSSTTQTIIGLSVNGGTSFAGTNTQVQAELLGI